MQWSDVTAPKTPKVLRQFAGLWLVFFIGFALMRAWRGQFGPGTGILAALGIVVGGLGLVRPAAMRPIFTGWMIAAFPLGWAISRVMLAVMFYVVFTPVALVFRLMGRDALSLRRLQVESYWKPKSGAADGKEYFRQS
jgi:hypothetical protein